MFIMRSVIVSFILLRGWMLMRSMVRPVLVAILVLTSMATSLQAQMLPLNLSLDSWFGVEYLFGRQDLHQRVVTVNPFQELRTRWDPRLAVLNGTIEATPVPFASARLGGAVSVASSTPEVSRNSADIDFSTGSSLSAFKGQLKSGYNSWEAAGLYHLWNGGGYRFSFAGGFRREAWLYRGDFDGLLQSENFALREEIVSNIPFIGLQTSMHFPWWKARFEVLGSWFVTKTFNQTVQRTSGFQEITGRNDEGGVLMFTMDGSCHITPTFLIGLQAQYSYQEFRGRSTVTSSTTSPYITGYRFFMNENLAAIGLNLTVVF